MQLSGHHSYWPTRLSPVWNESRREKICLRNFRPDLTQTGLYNFLCTDIKGAVTVQPICDPVLEERQVFSCRISVFENYAFQVWNNTLLSVRQWSDLHSIPTSNLGKRFSLLPFGCCFALMVNSRGHAGKVNLFRGWLNQTSQYISWTWVRSLVVSRRRANCELLSNEWATNTGKLPHEGFCAGTEGLSNRSTRCDSSC